LYKTWRFNLYYNQNIHIINKKKIGKKTSYIWFKLFIIMRYIFMYSRRQLNTLITKWGPFWKDLKMDSGWWKLDLFLVLMLCITEFAANWFLLLVTKSTSESIYCNCNGKTFNFLKYSLRESLVLAPIIIMIILHVS